ncbi:hypothetical protein [Spartinivicinus poritis]|uniref:Uncharacterized protein n=1 Tax=Spartinivicinus poritis TaxID=2994640 RepID=A0ABT5UI36_9GAMM|nr:hypothetical protein [Spartinivicinus sp. A2-2]MDE1466060.1 hypothetical protein [Spartinivicinus sp. A2-2]
MASRVQWTNVLQLEIAIKSVRLGHTRHYRGFLHRSPVKKLGMPSESVQKKSTLQNL